jgi:hypothetical protein
MEGIDLDQPALVLWWDDSALRAPCQAPQWGGSDRHFATLRTAINFVLTLSERERSTALINFDSPPHSLNFSDPGIEEWVTDLGA